MTTRKKAAKSRSASAPGEGYVRYVGRQPSVVAFGRRFHRGRWTSTKTLEAEALGLLLGNPQFEAPRAPRARLRPSAPDQEVEPCPPVGM